MTTQVSRLALANTTVAAGTYGGTSSTPVITVDAQGRLTYAANVTTTGSGVSNYSANIGNGTNSTLTVTHNLNKTSVIVTVKENSTANIVYPDITLTNANSLNCVFVDAPTTNQYSILVVGI